MKTRVGLTIALIITTLFFGCTQNTTHNGYTVMFDGPVLLSEEEIYFRGAQVGVVQAKETNDANITRVTIVPQAGFKDRVTSNLVVYAHAGRLHLAKVKNLGQPVTPDTPLLGFTSKSEYKWFKFKTLLSNRISAAQKRAMTLKARFS